MNFVKTVCAFFVATLCITACTKKEMKTFGGFKYEILEQGSGEAIKEGNHVYFDFDIMNDKDSVIQSYNNAETKPSLRIPMVGEPQQANPIIDFLKELKVGDKAAMYIPKDSMPPLPPQFGNTAYLKYMVHVDEQLTDEENKEKVEAIKAVQTAKAAKVVARFTEVKTQVESTIKDYVDGKLDGQLIQTPSGVKVLVHEEGTGAKAERGEMVSAQYYGALLDGSSFDNSFQEGRGSAYSFAMQTGGVIQGWHKGMADLKEGAKATLFIPSELGYGKAGSPPRIPGDSELVFYVEIEKIGN